MYRPFAIIPILLSSLLQLGCASTPEHVSDDHPGAQDTTPTVYRSPANYDFGTRPALLEKLQDEPYAYFRWVNIQFARAVCERFEAAVQQMPVVNLHGDAHLEQYAVTSTGRGLDDFDDAAQGPAVIDLVRFGASLVLACRELGCSDADSELVSQFFAGYRLALNDPEMENAPPDYVARVEAGFSDDRMDLINRSESLMNQVDRELEEQLREGYERYADLMRGQHTDLPAGFFVLKSYGALHIGIGSALDAKYLLRIEGPTPAPDDDVILEAKQVRDLSDITCLVNTQGGGAFRILTSRARLSGSPTPFLAFVPPPADDDGGLSFWIQSWHDNYRELDLEDDEPSVEDLSQIAFDVGLQLGRGHVLGVASPFDYQLRQAQLLMLDAREVEIWDAIYEMAELTLEGWRYFVGQL